MALAQYTLQDKIKAAKEIVKTFHLERYTFYAVATVSVLTLIFISVYSFIKGIINWELFVALFLPTGGIFIAAGLILKMFSDCLQFLKDELK